MKKIEKNAISGVLSRVAVAFFAIVSILTSCKEDEEKPVLQASVSTVEAVLPEGGTVAVDIESNNPWTINADKVWVHFDKASGGAGTIKVNVTVDANDKFESRTAKITIVSGQLTQELSVMQGDLKKFITLNKTEFKSDGASQFRGELVVASNVEYAFNKAQFPAWLDITETNVKGTFNVVISPNDEVPVERAFDVVVSDAQGFSNTFKAIQGPRGAFIDMKPADAEIEFAGSAAAGTMSREITILSSGELEYSVQAWGLPQGALAITLNATKGADGVYTNKIKFVGKPHISSDMAQWRIQFLIKGLDGENDPWANLVVMQYPQELPWEMNFTHQGGTTIYPIDLTGWEGVEFSTMVSEGAAEWLSFGKNAQTGKYEITALPNAGVVRNGTVTFSVAQGDSFYNEYSVTVTQSAAN